MCNKDDLVSYLYDDLDAPGRAAFERHLRGARECRDELEAMRGVRADLLRWSPPEPDFAFRIVSEPRAAQAATSCPERAVLARVVHAGGGLAAAAVLVLAAAPASRGSKCTAAGRLDAEDGVVRRPRFRRRRRLRRRRARATSTSARLRCRSVGAIERRISALEAASRDTGVRTASAPARGATDAEILKVVRDLLARARSSRKRSSRSASRRSCATSI
jgi:hypothetical protein